MNTYNIINVFENEHVPFFRYDEDDFMSSWVVQKILNKREELITYLETYDVTEINLISFIDYNWFRVIISYKKAIPLMKHGNEIFNEIIILIEKNLEKFDENLIWEFINDNYKVIYDRESYLNKKEVYLAVAKDTLQTVFGYFNAFSSDLFDFLEQEFSDLIYNHLEDTVKFYNKHPQRIIDLFNNKRNEHLFSLDNFPHFFNKLSSLKKPFANNIIEDKLPHVLNEMVKAVEEITEDNYMHINVLVEPVLNIFKKYSRSKKIPNYRYDLLEQTLEITKKAYQKKHFKWRTSEAIDLKPEIDRIKTGLVSDDSAVSFVSYITLTHNKKNNNIVNSFEEVEFYKIDKLNDPLWFMDDRKGTDDCFTPDAVRQLNGLMEIRFRILFNVLEDDKVDKKFKEWLTIVLKDVDKNESDGKMNLVDSFMESYKVITSIFNRSNIKNNNERYNIYTSTLFIITLIEKILRTIAINYNIDKFYYWEPNLTLGKMLKLNEVDDARVSMLSDILDESLILSLQYFLIITPEGRVGLNIRNKLAHNDIDFLSLDLSYPLIAIHLFLSVVNSLYIHYLKTNELLNF